MGEHGVYSGIGDLFVAQVRRTPVRSLLFLGNLKVEVDLGEVIEREPPAQQHRAH